MQSKLFSTHDLANSDELPKDIRALCDMSVDALARLPDYVVRAQLVPTRAEADDVSERAASDLGLPKAQVDRAIDVARFFLREFTPRGEAEKDTPEALVADLEGILAIPGDKKEAITALLQQLQARADDELRLVLLQRAHAEATLPILAAVSTQVDFRAVFDEDYKYEEDVSDFSPAFLGTVPLGIVSLSIRGGEKEKVSLQLSKRTLQILIDHLVALQKQMAIAEKDIGCAE